MKHNKSKTFYNIPDQLNEIPGSALMEATDKILKFFKQTCLHKLI